MNALDKFWVAWGLHAGIEPDWKMISVQVTFVGTHDDNEKLELVICLSKGCSAI